MPDQSPAARALAVVERLKSGLPKRDIEVSLEWNWQLRNAAPALLELVEALIDERERANTPGDWDEFDVAIERVDAALERLALIVEVK